MVAGIDCRRRDAIVSVELHCRLENLVISLSAAAKIMGDETSKQEAWSTLETYLETFPLDRISASQQSAGIVAIPTPDPQQGLQMRVPGLKGGTLGDILPTVMESSPIFVRYAPQSIGFMITVEGHQLSADRVENSVNVFFGNRENSADQFRTNYEKTSDTPVEVMYRSALRHDLGPISCFSSTSEKNIQLECLAGRVVVVLTQSGFYDNPEAIIYGTALQKLIVFAQLFPFQTIAEIGLE